ncbi:MAG: hypothetical protein QXK11_10765 [Pyrobaculum sp.]|uniref:hypothetical protein n=1 Tax=Pyrobaculum sp. TaxID=2004705 RepID=UPI00317F383C
MQVQTPLLELENYIVTYFGNIDDVPTLLKYTKYRIVKKNTSERTNILYAKIKGKGKKWVETTFTAEELKDVRDAVLIHNSMVTFDYVLVYDPKKTVETKGNLVLTYLDAAADPYLVENIQYLTRHVLRLFAVYDATEYSSVGDFVAKNKDEFAKRLVTHVDEDCSVYAISPVVTTIIYSGGKKAMCLFFDVL